MDMADCKDDRLTLEQMLAVPHAFYSEPLGPARRQRVAQADLLWRLVGASHAWRHVPFGSCSGNKHIALHGWLAN